MAKRPHIKCPRYRDRKDDRCNNQPKKLGYVKPRSNGKVSCPIHSFPDKPAKHSLAKCSKIWPTRGSRPRKARSTHITLPLTIATLVMTTAVQWSWTTQKAVDDQSLNRCSFSDYKDNVFVTFKAPPPPACKKAAEKVKHNNKLAKNNRKTVTSSNNNGKDMAYAQPFAALAKGLDKPLAFSSESN